MTSNCSFSVSNLTARSGGLFLYARYSVESAKRGRLSLSAINEIFPKGISSVYEEYVTRLQVELKVEEELFMNFLEAVVASQATLPESLVLQILGLKQTTRQEKKRAREALKSLGLLFPVVEKHISIFHKSLTDWLTEDGGKDEGHVLSVNLQDGHFVLAKHCLRVLRDVKNHACFPPELNDSEKYSLKVGFHHMLEDGGYKEQLAECVLDLELLSAMTITRQKKTSNRYTICYGISAIESLCSDLERMRKDWSVNPTFQDFELLRNKMYSSHGFVNTPQFVLECAANCHESSSIREKAVSLFDFPKYKHCVWIEWHTVKESMNRCSGFSCNEHLAVVCAEDNIQGL